MSKTEIVTPETQRREMENAINRAVRHCRIGKVTRKAPKPRVVSTPVTSGELLRKLYETAKILPLDQQPEYEPQWPFFPVRSSHRSAGDSLGLDAYGWCY